MVLDEQDNTTNSQENELSALSERRARAIKRANLGVKWAGLGSLILISSFAINLFFFFSSDQFTVLMYIMTIAGSACLIKGMTHIF